MNYKIENSKKALKRQSCCDIGLEEMLSKYFKGEKAWILFWEQYRVDFAWYDGNEVHWPEDKAAREEYLLEVRVFNEKREGHLRYYDGKMSGRILEETDVESKGEMVYKKTSKPYMWGSIVKDGVIREDRGMAYHLPCNPEATNFGYEVAQYYLPDSEDGMLRMLDYRMVKIYQEINRNRKDLEIGGVI